MGNVNTNESRRRSSIGRLLTPHGERELEVSITVKWLPPSPNPSWGT